MKYIPRFPLENDWTPEQALAVYDFCQLLTETLWQRYEDILIEQIIDNDQRRGFHHSRDIESFEPPFDDPF